MNIVIAGAGVAGITAAEKAKALNPKANVIIFSKEKELFYYRIRLPEILTGLINLEKITAHPRDWYQQKGLELRMGEAIAEIDIESRQIRGSMGSRLLYDKLLIATGAKANRFSVLGANLPQVWTLRTWQDAFTINLKAKNSKIATVIGGGLLGLETAAALANRGLTVRVIDNSPNLLNRQTTPLSSEILKKKLEEKGLSFYLNSSLESIKGTKKVESVELNDGTEIETDLVIFCAGVKSDLTLAKHLSLKTNFGIVVDDTLKTSLENVYATGDVCEHQGKVYGLWSAARSQGLVAGANLVQENKEIWEVIMPSTSLKVAGIDLVSAGDLDPDCKNKYSEMSTGDVYRKVVIDDKGCLLGYTILGDKKGVNELNKLLLSQKSISLADLKGLENPDFDFSNLT